MDKMRIYAEATDIVGMNTSATVMAIREKE
jgi:hypothetical protein